MNGPRLTLRIRRSIYFQVVVVKNVCIFKFNILCPIVIESQVISCVSNCRQYTITADTLSPPCCIQASKQTGRPTAAAATTTNTSSVDYANNPYNTVTSALLKLETTTLTESILPRLQYISCLFSIPTLMFLSSPFPITTKQLTHPPSPPNQDPKTYIFLSDWQVVGSRS